MATARYVIFYDYLGEVKCIFSSGADASMCLAIKYAGIAHNQHGTVVWDFTE